MRAAEKYGIDDAPVLGVLGRIHAVRHRQVLRDGIAESLVVVQHPPDVGVAIHEPAALPTAHHRAALASLVEAVPRVRVRGTRGRFGAGLRRPGHQIARDQRVRSCGR